MSELVSFSIEKEHIGIISLNRPDAANALSVKLLDNLNEILNEIKSTDVLRCIIITGTGEKAFCAGADLKERRGMSKQEVVKTVSYIGETVSRIEEFEIPTIAALNGVAFGGGLELSLACDIRIAAKDVKVGLTETSLAIIPGAGGTQRLPRLIGTGQAKRLIFTAARVDAQEAYALGIVEMVTNQTDILNEAIKMAQQIADNGPIAMKQAKKAIDNGMNSDLHTGLEIEHNCYQKTISTKDRIEGLQAFKEKRKPEYKGT